MAKTIAVALVSLSAVASAHAGEWRQIGAADDWRIGVLNDDGVYCTMSARFGDGSELIFTRGGRNPDVVTAFVGNNAWVSMTASSYPISLKINRNTYNANAIARFWFGARGVQVTMPFKTFSDVFASDSGISFSYNGKSLFATTIGIHSLNAAYAFAQCVKGTADPFAQ